jgi:predicted small secreted protein
LADTTGGRRCLAFAAESHSTPFVQSPALKEFAMKNIAAMIAVTFAFAIPLAGCNTVKGAGQDVQNAGQKMENAADKKK